MFDWLVVRELAGQALPSGMDLDCGNTAGGGGRVYADIPDGVAISEEVVTMFREMRF
jgi:hypothetical protein